MQENAKDENDKTAVDRELEGGRDIGGTVIFVDAIGTVLNFVASLAIIENQPGVVFGILTHNTLFYYGASSLPLFPGDVVAFE